VQSQRGRRSRPTHTAILTITDCDPPAPPVIRVQPVSRPVSIGGTVQFSVLVKGAPPLFYQWRHDGSDIPDAPIES